MAARSKAEAQPMGLPDLERHLSRLLFQFQLKRDTDSGLEKTLGIVYNLFPSFTKTVESISASESTDEKEIKKALQVAARFLITVEAMITQATAQATEHARRTKRQSYPQVIRDRVSNLQAVLESRGLTMPNLEEAMETTLASMGSTAEHRAVETTANAEVLNRADELGLRSRLLGIFIALLFLFGADTEAKGKQAIDLDLMPAGIPALIQELQSFAAEMRAEIDLAAMDTQEALLEFLQVENFSELQQNLSIAFGALQGGQQNGPEGDAPAMGGVDVEQQGDREGQQVRIFTVNSGISTLNVRRAPVDGAVLGTVGAGDAFTVISQNGDWVEIEYNDQTAWVSSRYGSVTSEQIALTPPATPATEVAQRPLEMTATPLSESGRENTSPFGLETTLYSGGLGAGFQESAVPNTFLREITAGSIDAVAGEYNLSSETVTALRYLEDLREVMQNEEDGFGAEATVVLAAVEQDGSHELVPYLRVDESFAVTVENMQFPVGAGSVIIRNDAGEMELMLIDSLVNGSVLQNASIVPTAYTTELRNLILGQLNEDDQGILPQADGIAFVQEVDPIGADPQFIRIVIGGIQISAVAPSQTPNEDIARVLGDAMEASQSSAGETEFAPGIQAEEILDALPRSIEAFGYGGEIAQWRPIESNYGAFAGFDSSGKEIARYYHNAEHEKTFVVVESNGESGFPLKLLVSTELQRTDLVLNELNKFLRESPRGLFQFTEDDVKILAGVQVPGESFHGNDFYDPGNKTLDQLVNRSEYIEEELGGDQRYAELADMQPDAALQRALEFLSLDAGLGGDYLMINGEQWNFKENGMVITLRRMHPSMSHLLDTRNHGSYKNLTLDKDGVLHFGSTVYGINTASVNEELAVGLYTIISDSNPDIGPMEAAYAVYYSIFTLEDFETLIPLISIQN